MSQKIWNEKIGKYTDWGGDSSTGGLPVSGQRVQEFIKQSLESKIGSLHHDSAKGVYLAFADDECREAYLLDPDANARLVLATLAAGGGSAAAAGASLSLTMKSPLQITAMSGQKGLAIEFSFESLNKDGLPTGDDVACVYTFRNNSVSKTVSKKYTAGTNVSMILDDYLENGVNTVSVELTGVRTGAYTSVAVTVNLIDLELSDEFDISRLYASGSSDALEIPYFLRGSGKKRMEWYIDGKKVDYSPAEDDVVETEVARTRSIPVGNLSAGTHSLQFRAVVSYNNTDYFSPTLFRHFAVTPTASGIMIALTLDPGTIIQMSSGMPPVSMSQYVPFSFELSVYHNGGATHNVSVSLDGVVQSSLSLRNGDRQKVTVTPLEAGSRKLKISVKSGTSSFQTEAAASVAQSSTSLAEITSGLALALSAKGKTNTSSDRDAWSYGSVTTKFTDFLWTDQSGWDAGWLVMSGGASAVTTATPLKNDATATGKTIEFEFRTFAVQDDNAKICDLRASDGSGILLTASEVSVRSRSGVSASVKFKSDESVRVSVVINRSSGVTNKQLLMIYVDGILSGAAAYSQGDSFVSDKYLSFISSKAASVALKEVRVYDSALSSDQILNNYILYRDSSAEMLQAYARNSIFAEDGMTFSTDALSGQLPVMIVTGDIPALEATTDKNLQIDVDVDYINLQDPTRSFSLRNAAMRPQGTSSMGYPKKNFRLYSDKKAATILLDYNGQEVKSRLYSFRKGAQPVDCWCLKADYAESSGSHNTGIARIWNDVMKDTSYGGQYVLRTQAQSKALAAGYPYDVRTAIDGFPIVLFYRKSESEQLTFIGKYNFNNDKSTESVFGFRDIPGFDNSRMQCWEVLNNGHPLALFKNIDGWDSDWAAAFEARYPDGNEDTTDLKAFAKWISAVSANSFAIQKWQYLDVYKVAAYYIYLLRFGAVDQVVKNAMLTSEDGKKWYFINYDNDTVLGLRNDGLLTYGPDVMRDTLDSQTGTYAYAGHDSRLWNLCEADPEFMRIVREIDQELYSAGLSYANVIKKLDSEQAGAWCERVFNQDAQYKYIGPYTARGVNNLFMLQGARSTHRRWWLSRRFDLIDAKHVCGAYKDNVVEMKFAGLPPGGQIGITPGADTYYGFGVNNVPIESGVRLSRYAGIDDDFLYNGNYWFRTLSELNIGDPLRVYAAPYIRALSVSGTAGCCLTQLSLDGAASERTGTRLEKLVLFGGSSYDEGSGKYLSDNTALRSISGIQRLSSLRIINVEKFRNLDSLDLSANKRLEWVAVEYCGSVVLPDGAPITDLTLYYVNSIVMRNLSVLERIYLITDHLNSIEVYDCPAFTLAFILGNNADVIFTSSTSVIMHGIQNESVEAYRFMKLLHIGRLELKGTLTITSASDAEKSQIREFFGNDAFSPGGDLYIKFA